MDAAELRERRTKLGLTQKQLAERLGYTENYIYMLEAERTPISSPQRFDMLLTAIEKEMAEKAPERQIKN